MSARPQRSAPAPRWLATEAKVTGCHYAIAGMNTLTLGVAMDSNRYTIDFTYHAHGKDFADSFTSPVAIGQGETITICYNPLSPQQNDKSTFAPAKRFPLFALGVGGSIVLSLLYLSAVRGCN